MALVLSLSIVSLSFAATKITTTPETETAVRPLPATPTACVINYFGATPSVIAPGSTSSIRWETTGCNYVMIDGVAYATNGSLAVGPFTASKFHTLTAYADASGCGTETCPFKRASVVVVPDVCPNIPAAQVVVPTGMSVDAQGNCVSATPSITITSPNGGEVFENGQQITVTWNSTGIDANTLLSINIYSNNPQVFGFLASNGTLNDGSETITLPQLPVGTNYTITVGVPSNGFNNSALSVFDRSDATFTIQAPNPATCVAGTPSVKILSPNGGEIYRVGDTLNIRWKHCVGQTSTFTVDNNTPVAIKLDDENIVATYGMQLIGTTNIGAGSYTWIIPNELGSYSSLNGNNYLIGIETTVHSVSDISDFSNSAFSITNTGGSPTLPAGCTSTSGYSTTTGLPCSGNTTTPPGCGNGNAYSPITGQSCGRPVSPTTGPSPSPIAIAVASPNASFLRELKLGTSGADVTALQNKLKAEGVYTSPITGYFGTMTQAAVKRYQTKYGIPAVGAVGPRTLQILNK